MQETKLKDATLSEVDRVTYSSSTSPGQRFRNTEFFTFSGESIASVDVYFGAAYQNGVIA